NALVIATTLVGYMVAVGRNSIDWSLLCHTLLGTGFCAACASVLNQVVERRHDAKMPRTRNRPLPAGRTSPRDAAVLGLALGIAGVMYLSALVNLLTACLGLITIVWYLALYTPAKRFTSLNTVIGAVPGAIPPVMGFTAATDAIPPGALALFGILFFWQMPHFLAIAILYRNDYELGGFRMLPCDDPDSRMTGLMMVLYAAALVPASLLPVVIHIAGPAYFTAAVLLGLAFLSFAVSCAISGSRVDARKLFFASIVYLPLLLAAMVADRT
ncbi:MAG: heme o synthase, partial [Tepidisphaeraceae bacterium]